MGAGPRAFALCASRHGVRRGEGRGRPTSGGRARFDRALLRAMRSRLFSVLLCLLLASLALTQSPEAGRSAPMPDDTALRAVVERFLDALARKDEPAFL